MANFIDNLKGLGRARLMALGGIGLAVAVGVGGISYSMSGPNYGLLYAELDGSDAGRIVAALEEMNVPYRAAGSSILVPTSESARLRMVLASQGLPSSGSVGYEVFDKQSSLGLTSFMQRVNRLRALEGELGRTIMSLDGIQAARVHLVMPEREAFTRDAPKPSASVVVRMRAAGSFSRSQAMAVRRLVAAAVPGLLPGSVTVMDAAGSVLAAEDGNLMSAQGDDLRVAMQSRIARNLETMLHPRVGLGNVRVQVSADLSLDREVTREESFDPDGRVVRSTQTREEAEKSSEASNDRAVTVEQNLPLGDVGGGAGANTRERQNTEETVNYEISSTVRERVREAGDVRRISVAIMVNGVYEKNEEGVEVYRDRSPEELARIENLVKSAIGFSESRGDMVTVESLQFIDLDDSGLVEEGFDFGRFLENNLMTLIQWVVLLALVAIISLFVVRPLMARIMEMKPQQPAVPPPEPAVKQQAEVVEKPAPEARRPEKMIDFSAVDGGVNAGLITRLKEVAADNPEDSLVILRSWLYEGKP